MEFADFVDLVAKMRQSQKDYFKNRGYNQLTESKRLEKEVDAAIEDMRDPKLF